MANDVTINFRKYSYDEGNGWVKYDNSEVNEIKLSIDESTSLYVSGFVKTSEKPQLQMKILRGEIPDVRMITIQPWGKSEIGTVSFTAIADDPKFATNTYTLSIGGKFNLYEITSGKDYKKYKFYIDVAFIKEMGGTKSNYPVCFYDTDGTCIHSEVVQDPNYNWRVNHGPIVPSESEWYNYQSSFYIEKGDKSPEIVELNTIANVFFKKSDVPSPSDNMRVIISCPKFKKLDFGEIQSITDRYNSTISAIPIIPYGHSNGFCMDLGVSRQITINFKRVMPEDPIDNSIDSRDWSNARWMEELRKYTDRWQQRTNGIQLYIFRPGNDSPTGNMDECYPPINPNYNENDNKSNYVNAYIIQSPLTYNTKSTNLIESSITFQIGTIYPKPTPTEKTEVSLVLKNDSDGSTITTVKSYFIRNARNFYPPIPATFYNFAPRAYFTSWLDNGTEHSVGSTLQVGDISVYPNELIVKTLFESMRTYYYEDGPTGTIDISNQLIPGETYTIYIMGGGGAGGDCANYYVGEKGAGGGGGGGAGYVTKGTLTYHGETVLVSIGKGGVPKNHGGGDDVSGHPTKILVNGVERFKADGGHGGGMGGGNDTKEQAEEEGRGGAGGTWGTIEGQGNGADGGHGGRLPSILDDHHGKNAAGYIEEGGWLLGKNYGLGGNATQPNPDIFVGGGGGGGMPDNIFRDRDGNPGYGGTGGYLAYRGNNKHTPKDGYLGGGGGGATDANGAEANMFGNGGNGAAMIMGVFKKNVS